MYGTVPIVRRTGGLADTVEDFDGTSGSGFIFNESTPDAVFSAVKRAVTVCRRDEKAFAAIQEAGMRKNFSWDKSAEAYLSAYRAALKRIEP